MKFWPKLHKDRNVFLKGMVRGTPAYQDTVAEGMNFTLFLGIWSEGEYAVMVGFLIIIALTISSSYSLVLAEDQEWAWKNTITLDNSRVQKNKFDYKKLLIRWKLSIAWTAPYSKSFFYLFIIFSLLEAQLNLLLGL